jgi:uncharacterized protein YkwD
MSQNKTAFILALILSGMIMVSFIPAMLEAKELTLIDHINSVRSKPLKEDKFLTELAKKRCSSMESWEHGGYSYWETRSEILYKYTRNGVVNRYKVAGENLAEGYTKDVEIFKALQNSPLHKGNNESLEYQKVGVARCINKVGNVTVILFAGN